MKYLLLSLFLNTCFIGVAEETVVSKLREIVMLQEEKLEKFVALAESNQVLREEVSQVEIELLESKIDLALEVKDLSATIDALKEIEKLQSTIVKARQLEMELGQGDDQALVDAKKTLLKTEIRRLRLEKSSRLL